MDSDQGKLFVGGISWETTDDTLRQHFTQYGEVVQTAVMRDKTTGRPRGFGFVVFSDPAVLDVVLQDQHTIDGRTVEAKRAMSREEQQSNPRSGFNNTDRSNGGGMRTKKIFVGGLPSTLTEEEFRHYFETFGSITDVVIMFDLNTQRPRGFGFISFEAESSVDSVLQKTYHDLNGKKVEVKRALPKDANNGGNRGSSGFGGGGGGYSGSAGSDSSYDGQVDGSRYMQPPAYGSSGYGGAAYGYGPAAAPAPASSGMGYGGYSSYGAAPQGGGRGGPWSSQGPSGYGAMGYGNGAPGSAPSSQSASGVAGYGSQGYGYGGYMGAEGGYGAAVGRRYGSSPNTAAQGNAGGGYPGSGGYGGDVNGNAGWRSDPSHAAPGNYASSGTYGGGGYSGGQAQ